MTCNPPVLVTAPTGQLLDLAAAKLHLRVTADDEDALITSLISAAGTHLEGYSGILGRCIRPQTWRTFATGFYGANLPFPNARTASVKYLDPAGVEQTLDDDLYTVVNRTGGSLILFQPSADLPDLADSEEAVRIDVEYGLDIIPTSVSTAVAMLVAYWYTNREGAQDVPPAVRALLDPLRMVRI